MKVYVGSTKNFKKRKREHFNSLKKGKHYNQHLQRAYNKHGKDCFSFIILEKGIEENNLWEREVYYISQKKSLNSDYGYNKGVPQKDDRITLNEETVEKKRKIAYEQFHGKTSDEKYQKWKEEKEAPKLGRYTLENTKKIYAFDMKTGELNWIYNSQREFSRRFNYPENTVRRHVDSFFTTLRTCKGFVLISEEAYIPGIMYVKKYKTPLTKEEIKKKAREKYTKIGRPVKEVRIIETGETFKSVKHVAEYLGCTPKAAQKVLSGERNKVREVSLEYTGNISHSKL